MEEGVRKDILAILEQAGPAVEKPDSLKLRQISDHTLHNASIYQDKDSIAIAVAMYALSKIVDRLGREPEISHLIHDAAKALGDSNVQLYESCMKQLMERISSIDSKLNLYIQKVVDEAEIRKGSRLYEHGISLAQTADLLGVSQWELMKYIGNTKIADKWDDEMDVAARIEHTRGLFGI